MIETRSAFAQHIRQCQDMSSAFPLSVPPGAYTGAVSLPIWVVHFRSLLRQQVRLAGQPNPEDSYAARYAHKRISYVLQIIETSQTTEYKWICHQQRRSSPNVNNLIVLFLPWSRREEARKIAQRKRERKVAARKHEGAFGTANQCRTSG